MSCYQIKALLRKNVIIMKRSPCLTFCEIFFPIVLMILLVLVKNLVDYEHFSITSSNEQFIQTNSSYYPSNLADYLNENKTINGMRILNPL